MEYLIDFSKITTNYLDQLSQLVQVETIKSFDQIEALDNSQLSYQTCFGSKFLIDQQIRLKSYILWFGYCHPNQELRSHIKKINRSLLEFNAIQSKRLGVYNKIATYYYQKFTFESPSLTKEQIAHVEKIFQDYRYSGIHMGQVIIDQEIEMIKLKQLYIDILSSNPITIKLSYKDLVGCDESVRIAGSNLVLSVSTFNHVLNYCNNSSTRKAVYLKYFEDIKSNSTNLEKIIKKRHELSNIFGFQSYSDLVLDTTMAKTKTSVTNFLSEMFDKYNPNTSVEQIKSEMGLSDIDLWDLKFYTEKIKVSKSGFKLEQIERLIDVNSLLTGVLTICREIFGFVAEEILDPKLRYSPDIKLYAVSRFNKRIGYFYLDIFFKPYKTPGARVLQLVPRSEFNLPIGMLICNFTSKVLFDNVITLLHEFGHMIHMLTCTSKVITGSIQMVSVDYVEIPSKFMENWGYTTYGLSQIVKPEYKHLITRELVSKLIVHRDILYNIEYSGYMLKSFIDLELHSSKNSNHFSLIQELNKKFYGITKTPKEINLLNAWPHLVGIYGGKFYSYMWSNEYAKKIFDKFEKLFEKNNTKELAKYYIEMLLEPGSLMNYSKSLNNFLDLKI
jgi:Zn-dependent oligopeptidase